MKKCIYLIGILWMMTLSSCQEKMYYMSTSFHEPATEGLRFIYSEDGLKWNSISGCWLAPSVGKQKIMRDPSLVRDKKGIFHLVWTSSWRGDLGFGYASSTDLINWSEPRFIETMAFDTTTVNVWAPELYYEKEKDQFTIVWASCIPGKFDQGEEEEKNNHRLFFTQTNDFKHFTSTQLFYDPGFSSIDATLVKRADQDYVMVVKDNTRPHRNIKVAFGESPEGPFGTPSEAFTDILCEGPSVARINDWYYIFYDAYGKKCYAASKTKDFKEFTDATSEISIPEGHKHGTIFKAPASVVENLLKKSNK